MNNNLFTPRRLDAVAETIALELFDAGIRPHVVLAVGNLGREVRDRLRRLEAARAAR